MTDVTPTIDQDRLARSLLGKTEDELDWAENQARTRSDIRKVDGAFLGLTGGISLLWLTIGAATVGGSLLAVGAPWNWSTLLPVLGFH